MLSKSCEIEIYYIFFIIFVFIDVVYNRSNILNMINNFFIWRYHYQVNKCYTLKHGYNLK